MRLPVAAALAAVLLVFLAILGLPVIRAGGDNDADVYEPDEFFGEWDTEDLSERLVAWDNNDLIFPMLLDDNNSFNASDERVTVTVAKENAPPTTASLQLGWLDQVRHRDRDPYVIHDLLHDPPRLATKNAPKCRGFPNPPPLKPMNGLKFPKGNIVDYTAYILKALDAENITYMLEGGALLGALRHGGFIPGDKDIDVFIPYWLNTHLIERYASRKRSCPDLYIAPTTSTLIMRTRNELCGKDWTWWSTVFWPETLATTLGKYAIKVKSQFQASIYSVTGQRMAYIDYITNPHRFKKYSDELPRIMSSESPCACRFGTVTALCPQDTKTILRIQFGPDYLKPDRQLADKSTWLSDGNGVKLRDNIAAWKSTRYRP